MKTRTVGVEKREERNKQQMQKGQDKSQNEFPGPMEVSFFKNNNPLHRSPQVSFPCFVFLCDLASPTPLSPPLLTIAQRVEVLEAASPLSGRHGPTRPAGTRVGRPIVAQQSGTGQEAPTRAPWPHLPAPNPLAAIFIVSKYGRGCRRE